MARREPHVHCALGGVDRRAAQMPDSPDAIEGFRPDDFEVPTQHVVMRASMSISVCVPARHSRVLAMAAICSHQRSPSRRPSGRAVVSQRGRVGAAVAIDARLLHVDLCDFCLKRLRRALEAMRPEPARIQIARAFHARQRAAFKQAVERQVVRGVDGLPSQPTLALAAILEQAVMTVDARGNSQRGLLCRGVAMWRHALYGRHVCWRQGARWRVGSDRCRCPSRSGRCGSDESFKIAVAAQQRRVLAQRAPQRTGRHVRPEPARQRGSRHRTIVTLNSTSHLRLHHETRQPS